MSAVSEIQEDWLERNRFTNRWVIVQEPEGYSVHVHSIHGVAPSKVYATKEEAAARLLQLLNIGLPVTPQDWPEKVEISFVSDETHEPSYD